MCEFDKRSQVTHVCWVKLNLFVTFSLLDIMKSKSNPDILKMAAAAAKRSERTMRSKVSFPLSGRLKVKSTLHPGVELNQDVLWNCLTRCVISL